MEEDEMNKQAFITSLDRTEAELYRQYIALERLRRQLQEEWCLLPDGSPWTPEKHEASMHSVKS
jgi:hypothetical protein